MNEESFKKVLYLIFKVLIKNNGYLSQLEIFKAETIFHEKFQKFFEKSRGIFTQNNDSKKV